MKTDPNLTPLEAKLISSYGAPPLRPEFDHALAARIATLAPQPNPAARPQRRLTFALLPLLALFALVVLIGPGKVMAQIRSWLNFIPGVGLVSDPSQVRVLAQPVTQERDGVTLTISEATLTESATILRYSLFGVPTSAFPESESITGCTSLGYLETEDGQQYLPTSLSDFPALPPGTTQATLVIPCLYGTLPGKAPENWRLPLAFIPAPQGSIAVTPVFVITTTEPTQAAPEASAPQPAQPSQPAIPAPEMVIDQVVPAEDGLILIGHYTDAGLPQDWFQHLGQLTLTDANGGPVAYKFPTGIQELINDSTPSGAYPWAVQFKTAGVTFPLTLRAAYTYTGLVEGMQPVPFTIDLPADQTPSRDIPINQTLNFGDHALELLFLRLPGHNTYDFYFKKSPELTRLSIAPPAGVNHTMEGLGDDGTVFSVGLSFAEPLVGPTTFTFAPATVALGTTEVTQTFTPPAELALPTSSAPSSACLAYDTYAELQNLPISTPNGLAVVYQPLARPDGAYGLVIYDYTTGASRLIAENATWSNISADGRLVVYAHGTHLMVYDVQAQTSTSLFVGNPFDPHWSPDGQWVAFENGDGIDNGPMLIRSDGTGAIKLPERGPGYMLGWSADSQRVYYSVISITDGTRKLMRYHLADGTSEDALTLTDLRRDESASSISPDEAYITYRTQDGKRVLRDLKTGKITVLSDGVSHSIEHWLPDGRLVIKAAGSQPEDPAYPLLLNPFTCELTRLPDELKGELLNLWLAP